MCLRKPDVTTEQLNEDMIKRLSLKQQQLSEFLLDY